MYYTIYYISGQKPPLMNFRGLATVQPYTGGILQRPLTGCDYQWLQRGIIRVIAVTNFCNQKVTKITGQSDGDHLNIRQKIFVIEQVDVDNPCVCGTEITEKCADTVHA